MGSFFSFTWRDAVKNWFGKTKLTYPQKSTAHPQITETHTAGKSSGTGVRTWLAEHPDYTGALLVDQDRSPGDGNAVVESLVYETLPGAVLTGATQNSNGVSGTITTQRVLSGTAATTGANVASSIVRPLDSLISEKETTTGVLWSNTGQEVHFGIQGTIAESVASSASTSTGINILSSSAEPQDALRVHNQTVTIPFSTTSVSFKQYDERGDAMPTVRTWVDPNSSLASQTDLVKVDRKIETKDRAVQDVVTYANRTVFTSYQADPQAQGSQTIETQTIVATTAAGTAPTIAGGFGILESKSIATKKEEAIQTVRQLNTAVDAAFPILTEYEWDDFAQALIKITKQVVAAGSTTAGITAGVLTEVKAIDRYHELKIISQFNSAPVSQPMPVTVEVSTPQWFTSGPTQIDTSSGYTAERGSSYATSQKHGHYAGTMTRTFSNTIPTAPTGTLLNFAVTSSRTGEGYANSGTEQYCKILYFDVPDHVSAAVTGTFLVHYQIQQHKMKWVLEKIEVTL